MRKKIRAIITAAVMLMSVGAVPAAGISEPMFAVTASAASSASASKEITLYGLNSDYADFISLPKGKDTFQIKVKTSSKVTYKVTKGDSVKVSSDGLIELNYETWYWYGGMGTTSSTMFGDRKPDYIEKRPVTGDSVITIKTKKNTYKLTVHVKEYSEIYASQKMDDYIKKNVTSSMTDYQKLEQACRYAASYNYSPYASDWISMTITGGGDCWASTFMIIEFLDRLGIEAQARDARSDPGAGSGHMNVLAKAGGRSYILEAGYNEKAPRQYNITAV